MAKVRITWNGMGGELDAVTVDDEQDDAITHAMMKLIDGQIVSAGDSFIVSEVEA